MEQERKEKDPSGNTEQRILDEAGKLFVAKGFAGTSTTEIARRAGCNQALVHYYFRTKENLFNRVFEEKARHIFTEFGSVESGKGTFLEKLERIIGIHFDILRENSAMILFLINEVAHDPCKLLNIKAGLGELPLSVLGPLNEELEAEIAKGTIRPVTIRDLIINILSLNATMFLVRPAISEVWSLKGDKMEQFLDQRKQEIIRTVMLSLRPE